METYTDTEGKGMETYTDTEVLEITKDIACKVWNTALLLGLMDLGKIGKAAAVELYGCGAENLRKLRRRYKREQREMIHRYYQSKPDTAKILAQLEFFLE